MVLTSLNLAFWEISGHNTIHITGADWTPSPISFDLRGVMKRLFNNINAKTLKALKN
jgi:hypothetical protein